MDQQTWSHLHPSRRPGPGIPLPRRRSRQGHGIAPRCLMIFSLWRTSHLRWMRLMCSSAITCHRGRSIDRSKIGGLPPSSERSERHGMGQAYNKHRGYQHGLALRRDISFSLLTLNSLGRTSMSCENTKPTPNVSMPNDRTSVDFSCLFYQG